MTTVSKDRKASIYLAGTIAIAIILFLLVLEMEYKKARVASLNEELFIAERLDSDFEVYSIQMFLRRKDDTCYLRYRAVDTMKPVHLPVDCVEVGVLPPNE